MVIVSFPYAVLKGGYWALLAMVVTGGVCSYTGRILVRSLYDIDEYGDLKRVRHSYGDIARRVLGTGPGVWIVNGAICTELLMTCILYLILCGDLLQGSFPQAPLELTQWIYIGTLLTLPVVFLTNIRQVSWMSLGNTVSHVILNVVVILYCLWQAPSWHPGRDLKFQVDIWTLPISLGIVVFSYTSHVFLPILEGTLFDRSCITGVIYWTHGVAALAKVLFGLLGFLTFAGSTQEVITNNIQARALRSTLNLVFVAKAVLSYPLPFFAACDLIREVASGSTLDLIMSGSKLGSVLKVGLKCVLLLITMTLAIWVPHFAILMGLIGSVTGAMLSLAWPSFFYLSIHGASLRPLCRALNWSIITFALLFTLLGVFYSSVALFRAMTLPPFNDSSSSSSAQNGLLPIFKDPYPNATL